MLGLHGLSQRRPGARPGTADRRHGHGILRVKDDDQTVGVINRPGLIRAIQKNHA
ncbi:hypothetical protein [Tropicimonas aquimaris]|uniref:CBS domain-containing protein n=1 Tax=Tropicimonas aquimaris TaxID=914152 RepID=A0ABW3IWP9_9RHOB